MTWLTLNLDFALKCFVTTYGVIPFVSYSYCAFVSYSYCYVILVVWCYNTTVDTVIVGK